MQIQLKLNAADVARLQRDAETDAPLIRTVTVETAEDYAAADELLSEIVRRKDALVAMRKTATGPLYETIKTVEGWFRPVVQLLEGSEKHLKGELGRFRLRAAEEERKAREAAAAAAKAGEAEALLASLTTAAQAAAAPAGRATVGTYWAVESVDAAALPREYLVPDMPALTAMAKAHKGDTPPVVPGVKFVRAAKVGARR